MGTMIYGVGCELLVADRQLGTMPGALEQMFKRPGNGLDGPTYVCYTSQEKDADGHLKRTFERAVFKAVEGGETVYYVERKFVPGPEQEVEEIPDFSWEQLNELIEQEEEKELRNQIIGSLCLEVRSKLTRITPRRKQVRGTFAVIRGRGSPPYVMHKITLPNGWVTDGAVSLSAVFKQVARKETGTETADTEMGAETEAEAEKKTVYYFEERVLLGPGIEAVRADTEEDLWRWEKAKQAEDREKERVERERKAAELLKKTAKEADDTYNKYLR